MFVSRITICIAAWNSMEFLPALLSSISKQTFTDVSIVVIDNASQDELEPFLRKNYPSIMLLRNVRNLGRSAAYNQVTKYVVEHSPLEDSANRYILFVDPHVILEEDCLEKLVRAADERPSASSFCPTLLRAYSENAHDESLKETIKSERIESCGFSLSKNKKIQPIDAGKMSDQKYLEPEEVFGSPAAMSLMRLYSLMTVAYTNMEVFDPILSEGVENVDLAWRMQISGFNAWCIKEARAYHHLGKFKKVSNGWWSKKQSDRNMSIQHRRQKSFGYWLIVLKNETFFRLILLFPRLIIKFFGGILYSLFFDRTLFSVFPAIINSIPHVSRRRRHLQDLRRRHERHLYA